MRINIQPWIQRQIPYVIKYGIVLSEHLTLCFSIVNITLVSFFVIATFATLVFWILVFVVEIDLKQHVDRSAWKSISEATNKDYASEILGFIIMAILTGFVGLLFSAVLVHGVWRRKSKYIKLYFCYGVVMVLLTLLAVAYYLDSIDNQYIDPYPIFITLSVLSAYALILCLIYVTYQQYKAAVKPTEVYKYGDKVLFIETESPKK